MTEWISSFVGGYGTPQLQRLPNLPCSLFKPDSITVMPLPQLHGSTDNAQNIFRYWQAHRSEPDSKIYYAYYANYLEPSDERSFITAMRLGEQIDPKNALYNIRLAEYFLTDSMRAQAERAMSAPKTDELLDRRRFLLGVAELRKACAKPYLCAYHDQILKIRLNSLHSPVLTENYLQHLNTLCSEMEPEYASSRALVRKIPSCARILLTLGQRHEAELVMDCWKPYIKLLVNSTDKASRIMKQLVALGISQILTNEGYEVYRALGDTAKAEEIKRSGQRLFMVKERFRHQIADGSSSRQIDRNPQASMIQRVLLPTFGGEDPSGAVLTPGRMHEQTLVAEAFIGVLLVLLTLAMLGVLFESILWLYRLRGAQAVPLLLMPPAHVLLRVMGLGVLLPLAAYWLYAHLPVIGSWRYGVYFVYPRLIAEYYIIGALVLWVPSHLLRRYIRQRCDELSIAVSAHKEETSIRRRVRFVVILASIILVLSLFGLFGISLDVIEMAIVSSIGILGISAYFSMKMKRQTYGLYYGTLARSLAPLYALAVIVLSCTVQPWLLYQEAYWLKHDTLCLGNLAKSQGRVLTSSEEKAASRLNRLIVQALDEEQR